MSHFAKVVNGVVTQVIAADQLMINSGILGNPKLWIQTSYNTYGGEHPNGTPLRKNYAGIGYTYDSYRDAFYAPKPFKGWILNENSCLWEAPIPYPTDGKIYTWNESSQHWETLVV